MPCISLKGAHALVAEWLTISPAQNRLGKLLIKMLSNNIRHNTIGVLLILATVKGNTDRSYFTLEKTTTSGTETATLTNTSGHVNTTFLQENSTSVPYSHTTKGETWSSNTSVGVPTLSSGIMVMSVASSSSSSVGITTAEKTDSAVKKGDVTGPLILIFIIFIIVFLIIIILKIRKRSRQYSFDLNPKGHEDIDISLGSVEQRGVFASNQNDEKSGDFSYADKEKDETSMALGEHKPQTEEKFDNGHDLDKSSSEDSLGSQSSLTPNDKPLDFNFDLIDGGANQSSDTSTETLGDQKNENNNNTTARHRTSKGSSMVLPFRTEVDLVIQNETFTEISLDEPV